MKSGLSSARSQKQFEVSLSKLLFLIAFLFLLSTTTSFALDSSTPPIEPLPKTMEEQNTEIPQDSESSSVQNKENENIGSIPEPTRDRSGFIVKNLAQSGYILKSYNPRTILGTGEIIYVKKGGLKDLKVGQKLTVFSAKRKVFQPKPVNEEIFDLEYERFDRTTDSYFMAANDLEINLSRPIKDFLKFEEKPIGYIVKNLGTIEILEKGEFSDKAIIRETFIPIKSGDRLVPYTSKNPQSTREKDIVFEKFEAAIIAFSKIGTLASLNDIIFIDKGQKHGLIPGDRLEVFVDPQNKESGMFNFWKTQYQVMPSQVIGKIQILSTNQTTSTI